MNISIDSLIGISLVAGIFGTSGMTIFLQMISKSGTANTDMVRALGSLFTKSMDSAFKVGIIIHITSGIIFAFLYTLAITSLNVHGFLSISGAGLIIGFIHGGVVCFLLVTSVAENHPLPEFQKVGFEVAIIHWVAHVIFGLIVGMLIGLISY